MPSSRRSSQLRDQTQVSHTAGGFFAIWATKEAHKVYHFSEESGKEVTQLLVTRYNLEFRFVCLNSKQIINLPRIPSVYFYISMIVVEIAFLFFFNLYTISYPFLCFPFSLLFPIWLIINVTQQAWQGNSRLEYSFQKWCHGHTSNLCNYVQREMNEANHSICSYAQYDIEHSFLCCLIIPYIEAFIN